MTLMGSALCLSIFYLLYRWRLSRETFWQANRIFLLLTPFLSFAIPHVQLAFQPDAPPVAEGIDPELLLYLAAWRQNASAWLPEQAVPEYSLQFGRLLLWIYLAGVLWRLGQTLRNSLHILYLARRGERHNCGDYILVTHSGIAGPASFFRYVFSPSPAPLPRLILEHELAHVRQWHSLDLLLMELWTALHWYNPLAYRLREQLRVTHEYIADAAVVGAQSGAAYDYARLLVHQPKMQIPMLYNTFAAQIAGRLRMLAQKPSAPWRMVHHAVTLPLGAGMAMFFSVSLIESTPLAATMAPVTEAIERLEQTELATLPAETERLKLQSKSLKALANLPVLPGILSSGIHSAALGKLDTLPDRTKVIIVQQSTTDTVVVVTPEGKTTTKVTVVKKTGTDTIVVVTPEPAGAKPLIVIDGQIQEAGEADLNTMDPAGILSVNVLKGESAVAIYGERGANGVIMITTKQGGAAQKKGSEDTGNPDNIQIQKEITITVDKGSPGKIRIAENGEEGRGNKEDMTFGLMRIVANGELIGEIENPKMTGSKKKEPLNVQKLQSIRIEKGKEAVSEFGPKGEKGVIIMEFPDRESAEKAYQYYKKQK